jgi:hypothetical protein
MLARLGLSRSQLLLLVALAAILVALAFFQSQPEIVEPYDPDDTGGTGLAALRVWLEEMDYPVQLIKRRDNLPETGGLLFIHPTYSGDPEYYDQIDALRVYTWVRRGGTLVLVGPNTAYTALSVQFGVEQVATFSSLVTNARQIQPLLPDVPSEWQGFTASYALRFTHPTTINTHAVVPLIAHASGEAVVALQFVGDGVIWHLTEDVALTNANLRDDRIAALLPAILRTVPAGGNALISTHHLASTTNGTRTGEVATLQDWLYTTPFGQATLLIMVATLLFLLLQGRRLGPPLPGSTATRPREAGEYVTALAGLQRRIRQPRVVADHHRHRLKSAIGRLTHAPADLPDAEWMAQVRRADILPPSTLDAVGETLAGFAKLTTNAADEQELIRLLQTTDALLASLPRANLQLVR